jgi:hypothetical protein
VFSGISAKEEDGDGAEVVIGRGGGDRDIKVMLNNDECVGGSGGEAVRRL